MRTLTLVLLPLFLIAACGNDAPPPETDPAPPADPVLTGLLRDLGSPDKGTWSEALYSIREMDPKSEAAIPALDKALDHEDYDMQVGAAEVLVMTGEPAVETLLRATKDGRLHDDALERLGHLGSAGEPLVAAIFDRAVAAQKAGHEKTVWSAANALEEIGAAGLAEAVTRSGSADEDVRRVAMQVIGQCASPETADACRAALEKLAQDPVEWIRTQAGYGLEALAGD